MPAATGLTPRGAATRARIVDAAAELVLRHGVAGTSLDDIRAVTATSKSQLFHYFPEGKAGLVAAVAELQGERVLDAQRPFIEHLDSWDSWSAWRDAVLEHYGSQDYLGCPISALASEVLGHDPEHASSGRDPGPEAVAVQMDRWRGLLVSGVARMQASGLLFAGLDPGAVGLAIFASLHGGLLLMQTMRSPDPLEAALDGALTALRACAL